MKAALVQTNPLIGDVNGNLARLRAGVAAAGRDGAELIICPEQSILGYPAKDLLLRPELIERNVAALQALARDTARFKAGVIVGFAEPNPAAYGRRLFNSAALLHGGRVQGVSRKRLLPTYDVFDEVRYFEPGPPQPVLAFQGRRLGLTVCEDMWSEEEVLSRKLYNTDPLAELVQAGAELLINISASPYYLGKQEARRKLIRTHAMRHRTPILFCNQVGGNDELLFDGGSCVIDCRGALLAQAKAFEDDILHVDLERPADARHEAPTEGIRELHDALVMGLRDYVRKCGFSSVVLGLSGGVDSAVVACLAAAALGPQQVLGVAMPSRYSSGHSRDDARVLAERLQIRFAEIPIEPMHAAFEHALAPHFTEGAPGIAEENVQARVRGVLLMALSNKSGGLLLTTGNKSELAVGYCTLYGDMAGGLAVISDVPKTMVYALARHINERARRELIPASTLTKPPSAELKPNQTDQDSLPPYEVLDEILRRYEERFETPEQICAAGFDPEVVCDVIRRVHVNEYKRQQAAPGLKVTARAFGFGRRMPIAARPTAPKFE